MPCLPFATAVTPSVPTPTRLPWIVQPLPEIPMPSLPLPEITLPAPAAVPPIVFPEVRNVVIPVPVFGSAATPVASVPIQLPTMRFPDTEPPDSEIPLPFPEIRLRALESYPPMRLPGEFVIVMPEDELGLAAAVPATFVPM
jgi:hypothetical protein